MTYLKKIQIQSTKDDENEDEGNEDDDGDDYDRGHTASGLSHSKISQLLKMEREKLQGKYFKYVSHHLSPFYFNM